MAQITFDQAMLEILIRLPSKNDNCAGYVTQQSRETRATKFGLIESNYTFFYRGLQNRGLRTGFLPQK